MILWCRSCLKDILTTSFILVFFQAVWHFNSFIKKNWYEHSVLTGMWLGETASSILSAPSPTYSKLLVRPAVFEWSCTVHGHWESPALPFLSHLLPQSCLIFRRRHVVRRSVSGLSHREATDQLKAKISLIEYWSGIVRQAEMTKFTHENKAAACCAFSAAINSAGQRDVSISQELHGLVITAASCDHVVANLVKTHAARWEQ